MSAQHLFRVNDFELSLYLSSMHTHWQQNWSFVSPENVNILIYVQDWVKDTHWLYVLW